METFCDYVAILNRGNLVLEGNVSALIAGRGYRVVTTRLPEQVLASFRRSGAIIAQTRDGIEIQVVTLEESNRVIDEVRAAGGLIESVSASSSSLEDIFIRAMESKEAA